MLALQLAIVFFMKLFYDNHFLQVAHKHSAVPSSNSAFHINIHKRKIRPCQFERNRLAFPFLHIILPTALPAVSPAKLAKNEKINETIFMNII